MKITELSAIITAEFIRELYQEDLEQAERVRDAGCPHCGGVLHSARYRRKPRGLEAVLPELESRESFCCAECRKRRTPESVRFLGRKVYLAVSIAVAAIMRGHGEAVAKICAAIGVSDDTERRWVRWLKGPVYQSPWWKVAQALVVPAIVGNRLIVELYERLREAARSVQTALRKLLTFINPITVPGAYPS